MVIAMGALDYGLPNLLADNAALYLLASMALGAMTFAAVVALLWWSAGLEDGAEAKLIEQLRGLLAKLR